MSCYMIKSRLSGLYLDVEGQGGPGSKVIPWDRHGKPNQVWYDCPQTGTIRSVHNNCALATENDQLYVKQVNPSDPNQHWCRQGEYIKNRTTGKCLDVYRGNKEKLAQIGPYDSNRGINQQFDFETVPGSPPSVGASAAGGYQQQAFQKRFFHIKSEMNGKVLDVAEGKNSPGTKIVMWKIHAQNPDNQKFWCDQAGVIHSYLGDLVISNGGKGQGIVTAQPSGDPRSQFRFQGNKIVNGHGECLDISRRSDKDGAEVITWESNDGKNQHWTQDFC